MQKIFFTLLMLPTVKERISYKRMYLKIFQPYRKQKHNFSRDLFPTHFYLYIQISGEHNRFCDINKTLIPLQIDLRILYFSPRARKNVIKIITKENRFEHTTNSITFK